MHTAPANIAMIAVSASRRSAGGSTRRYGWIRSDQEPDEERGDSDRRPVSARHGDVAYLPRLRHFWSEILGGEPVQRSDDWHYVYPPGWTRIACQRVPENKTTKNRLHIDVQVPDLKAAAASATTVGALTVGPEVTDAAGSFQVMHDPEGNEWCLVVPTR